MKSVKILLLTAALLALCVNASAVNVPILLYHNTYAPYNDNQAAINCTPPVFEEHLKALTDAGYHVIALDDYVKYTQGSYSMPEKPLVITFDDGYLSNYLYAYPLLKKYNMKATIFVITGRMGDNDTAYPHFSWEQAKEMEQSGTISIYSHTDSHQDLTGLSDAQLQLELRRSKYMVEKEMNKKCDIIAYPYGMFDDRVASFALAAGYTVTCKVGDIGSNVAKDGLTGLKRLTVHGDMSSTDLLEMIENN